MTLQNQHLGAFVDQHDDPLVDLTYGGWASGEGLVSRGASTLATKAPTQKLHIRIHALTDQTDTPGQWLEELERQRMALENVPLEETLEDLEWTGADPVALAETASRLGDTELEALVPRFRP